MPRGSSLEIQRLQDKAERLFRGQGNHSGRGRLWADGTNRPEKYPRGIVVSTGEDLPKGQSLRARLLATEIGRTANDGNVMDWRKLTQAQADAGAGLYAEAMAAFLQWLASRLNEVQKERAALLPQLRDLAATQEQHKRLPELVANLTIGLGFFLRFAVAVEAISQNEAATLLAEAWEVFGRAATAQRRYQSESEQTTLYREMIGAALAGGLAHVALEDGNAPLIEAEETIVTEPQAWGWRKDHTGEWRAQGQRIGWLRVQYAETYRTAMINGDYSFRQIEFADKMLTQAQNRFFRALESLEKVRKLQARKSVKALKTIKVIDLPAEPSTVK